MISIFTSRLWGSESQEPRQKNIAHSNQCLAARSAEWVFECLRVPNLDYKYANAVFPRLEAATERLRNRVRFQDGPSFPLDAIRSCADQKHGGSLDGHWLPIGNAVTSELVKWQGGHLADGNMLAVWCILGFTSVTTFVSNIIKCIKECGTQLGLPFPKGTKNTQKHIFPCRGSFLGCESNRKNLTFPFLLNMYMSRLPLSLETRPAQDVSNLDLFSGQGAIWKSFGLDLNLCHVCVK